MEVGFDIRAHRIAEEATGEIFVTRIEVKGRLPGQPVRLIVMVQGPATFRDILALRGVEALG